MRELNCILQDKQLCVCSELGKHPEWLESLKHLKKDLLKG